MKKNMIKYIFIGIMVAILDFFVSVIIGDSIANGALNALEPFLVGILISIIFLTAVVVICTLLIISNQK